MSRHMLFGGHIDSRGPVNDEEELVAWLASTGYDSVSRDVENPGDLGETPELSLAATFKERDSLEPLNLVVLPSCTSGGDGFQATFSIVRNRPVHHPADQFHSGPPVSVAPMPVPEYSLFSSALEPITR